MKITEVKVDVFEYQSQTIKDIQGHSHPGKSMTEESLLTIITDEGAKGYCFGADKDLIENIIKPRLQGKDPFSREFIWQNLAERTRRWNTDDSTLAAVDLALWDLAGQITGLPVYKMIGAYRDKIKAYASTMVGDDIEGGLNTPAAYANFAEKCLKKGYRAIKIHGFFPPQPGAPDPKLDAEVCKAVRERVGEEIDLMLDPYHDYNREQALSLGRELEKLNFSWYEEPMNEYSISSYVWLNEKLDLPVLGPEIALGRHHTRAEWIKRGACDMLRVGVTDVGGLTPALKIVGMAQCYRMSMDVHGPHSGNLHLLGAMRNSAYFERGLLHPHLDYNQPPPYLNNIHDKMDEDGYVHIPQKPGLGQDINFNYIQDNLILK